MKPTHCYYVEGSDSMIDTVDPLTGLTTCFKETKDQIVDRYPGANLVPIDDAIAAIRKVIDKKYITIPSVTTEEEWMDLLCVLPPKNYNTSDRATSFMLEEFTIADITTIGCNIDDIYFTFSDRCTLTHFEILEKCYLAHPDLFPNKKFVKELVPGDRFKYNNKVLVAASFPHRDPVGLIEVATEPIGVFVHRGGLKVEIINPINGENQ